MTGRRPSAMVCIAPALPIRSRGHQEMLYPHVTYLGPAHPDASPPATMLVLQGGAESQPRAVDIPGEPVLFLVGPPSEGSSGSPEPVATAGGWSSRLAHGGWSLQDALAA